MTVKKLLEIDREKYQNFVTAHKDGSFLQSWSWGNFKATQKKSVVRYGIFDNESLVGTVQLFRTIVPHLSGYYLYSPYGPVLNNTDDIAELISEIKKDFPDAWFIRLESKAGLPISGETTVHIQPGKTLVTNLVQSTEQLLAGMDQKTRYNIKVANKHGVSVSNDTKSNEQAVELLTKTSHRQEFHSHKSNYYSGMLDFFLGNSPNDSFVQLYCAVYNSEVIASAIFIDHGNTRTYLFGGSSDNNKNVMAPYALHWQAIQDAKENGLTQYDWWGIETATGKTPGFVKFKLKWGGHEVLYPKAIDLVQNRFWYSIYKVLRKINRLF